MRIEGWERRLADYLAAARARPFTWGQHDCALWVAGWAEECTGPNYTDAWIGQYHDEASALALVKSRGFKTFTDVVDAHADVKPVMLAQRGDIMLHPTGALGICNGLKSHFIGERGAFTDHTIDCVRAWKVG